MRNFQDAYPWLDYLFVSQEEMKRIVNGTGWTVQETFSSAGPTYISIIQKLPFPFNAT